MTRVLAFLCGVCIAADQAYADPKVDAVDRIIIPVSTSPGRQVSTPVFCPLRRATVWK